MMCTGIGFYEYQSDNLQYTNVNAEAHDFVEALERYDGMKDLNADVVKPGNFKDIFGTDIGDNIKIDAQGHITSAGTYYGGFAEQMIFYDAPERALELIDATPAEFEAYETWKEGNAANLTKSLMRDVGTAGIVVGAVGTGVTFVGGIISHKQRKYMEKDAAVQEEIAKANKVDKLRIEEMLKNTRIAEDSDDESTEIADDSSRVSEARSISAVPAGAARVDAARVAKALDERPNKNWHNVPTSEIQYPRKLPGFESDSKRRLLQELAKF